MTQCQRPVWTPNLMRMTNFKHRLLYLSNHSLILPDSSLVFVLVYFIAVVIRWDGVFVLPHCRQSFQMLSVKTFVPRKGTPQKQKLNLGNYFFDNATLESFTDFTTIKIGLRHYLFQSDIDTKETDIEIHTLFAFLYMAGMKRASHMNIDVFYQRDGTGVEFFRLVMPKKKV